MQSIGLHTNTAGYGWRRALQIGVTVMALGGVAASIGYVTRQRLLATSSPPAYSGPAATVQVGAISSVVRATGSVVSVRQSKLAPQASGRLAQMLVQLGDHVQQGQPLARLDRRPLEIKLEQAQSALNVSRLKLQQLRAGSKAEDIAQAQDAAAAAQAAVSQARAKLASVERGALPADVAAAQQAVDTARANVQKAQAGLAKLQSPKPEDIQVQRLAVEQAKDQLLSQQLARDVTCSHGKGGPCDAANATVDAAQTSVDQAVAQLASLISPNPKDIASAQADVANGQAALRGAVAKLDQLNGGPLPEDVKQAEAAVTQAQANYRAALAKVALLQNPNTREDIALAQEQVVQAQLAVKQAQLDLSGTILAAPYDGVVSAITANEGEQVSSATPVLTLIDTTTARINANVDENDVSHISLGQAATVAFDAQPGHTYGGDVVAIAPNATDQSGAVTYTVSVALTGGATPPPFGATASLQFTVGQSDHALLIPNGAIVRAGGRTVVNVVSGGALEPQPVTTGLTNGRLTEVTRGLTAGQRVAVMR